MTAEHQDMVREAWSLLPWAADAIREAVVIGGTALASLAAAGVTFFLARRSAS